MLVKVHVLRSAGKRLPAGTVRVQASIIGRIQLYPEARSTLGQHHRVAVLKTPDGKSIELHEVQLTQWDARGLILDGEERLYDTGRGIERHRQAWWCRPLGASELIHPTPSLEMSDDLSDNFWIEAIT